MRYRVPIAASMGLIFLLTGSAYAQTDFSGLTPGSSGAGDSSAVESASGTPSPIDLLVDSDSYIPPFYRGRALPSAGTDIRLLAIPYFKNGKNSYIPSSDIIYTWKQDDRVLGNLSGLGDSSVVLPAAILYGTTDIEVDARSSDNTYFGTATLKMPSVDPFVLLYEDNPLLGITYYHALGGSTVIPDIQMTFAAVPYFAQIQSPNDPRLSYAWTVNGSNIPSNSADPSEITLNSSNSNGLASVGVAVTHATNIFMDSSGQWDITLGASNTFGSESNAGTSNAFTGNAQ